MEKFERIVKLRPAYDKRNPEPKKDYGIHGVDLLFVLKGKKGAVQFLVFTGWHLPKVQKELDEKPFNPKFPYLFHKPMPADIGYHSPKPMYEDHKPLTKSCKILDGKPCYYDGSGLQAEKVFEILVREGSEGLWKYLEKYYNATFQ